MNPYLKRLIQFIAVFVAVLVLPWWLSVIIVAGLAVYFPFYPEILFFGFLFDTLYASRLSFPYTGLSLALVFLAIVMFVRTRVRT